MRLARRLALLALLLPASASALSYALFLRPAALKGIVRNAIRQYLSAEIELGSVSIRPFSGLALRGIGVRTAPGGGILFKADRIGVRPRWSALARMKFQVKELRLHNADLRFTRNRAGRSNWHGVVARTPRGVPDAPPVFSLSNGRLTIGDSVIRGLDCELAPFPSGKLVAVRGKVDDPFWGAYNVSGNMDLGAETIRISLEARDLTVNERWLRAFPPAGGAVWDRYRPAGLFDLDGNISLSWGAPLDGDYNLIFTAKDASCRYLAFPVTGATARIFVDPRSVIVNHLEGKIFDGGVAGYTIANLDPPCTFYNRYTFEDVDIGSLLRRLQPAAAGLRGSGAGYVEFHGDHCRGELAGRGEISVSNARLWEFPVLLPVISKAHLAWPTGHEPAQECRIVYTFTRQRIRIEAITLTSDLLDLYGSGTVGLDGALDLTLYARPAGTGPFLLAGLLQPALDSVSGGLAQFRVTGTASDPAISVIPLSPVAGRIVDAFDSLTTGRPGP